MSNYADPARLSPDERLREAAAILAGGALQLRRRARCPPNKAGRLFPRRGQRYHEGEGQHLDL